MNNTVATYDAWHAQGLRWLASLLESAAARLEAPAHEAGNECESPNCVEEVRLRASVRGFQ